MVLIWANFSLDVPNPQFLIHRVFTGAVMTLLVEVHVCSIQI